MNKTIVEQQKYQERLNRKIELMPDRDEIPQILGVVSDFEAANTKAVLYKGSIFEEELSNATIDNAIVFAGSSSDKRKRRQMTQEHYYSKWFPGIKGDYNPTTNTGTDDLSAVANAINATPDGWVFVFEKNKNYRFGNNTITLDGTKSVHIDLNGSTLWQTANKFLFDYRGPLVWTQNVSALSTQDVKLRADYSTTSRVLRIALTSLPADLAIGDVLKLTSENTIPNSRPDAGDGALARMGEFVVVSGLDAVNNYIYTSAVPYEIGSYTTNIKVSKISEKTLTIRNGNLSSIDAGDAGNWLNGFIKATNCAFARFEQIKTYKSWGPTLDLRGLYMPQVDDIFTKNADTKESNNVGYLIRDIGCQGLQASRLRGTNLRHIYATNQSYIPASELSTRLGDYGRSMHNSISDSIGWGANGGAFDTHSEAYDVSFHSCRSYNAYIGAVSNGEGMKIRGKQIRLYNCISTGHKYGIQVLAQYAGGTNDVQLFNCQFEGWSSAIRTEIADTGDRVLNLRMFGGELRTTGQDAMDISTTNVTFDKVRMYVDNVSFTRFVVASTSANVRAVDCEYVCPRSSATLVRLVALEGSNARVDVFGGFLRSNKDIDRLIHTGTFSGGRVGINGVFIDRAVTQIINPDNISTYAYSYRIETNAGVRSKSGVFKQTISANDIMLDGVGCLDDERQRTLTPTGANRTGLQLPPGQFEWQKEVWHNDSNTFTVEVNGSVTAVNGIGRAYWNGTAWKNY